MNRPLLHAFRRTALACLMAGQTVAHGGTLDFQVDLVFDGAPLEYDTITHRTSQRQRISVERLDMLLSGFTIQSSDGKWHGCEDTFAFVSGRENQCQVQLAGLPEQTEWTALRFNVGLPSAINHADPAQWAPGHPLNPRHNGLHWNWQGGYIFLALEGKWQPQSKGSLEGYSFHLATDAYLTEIETLLKAPLRKGTEYARLELDVKRLFDKLTLTPQHASTHSRGGDPVAATLSRNLGQAWALRGAITSRKSNRLQRERSATDILVAPSATPFRFQFPAYFPRPQLPQDNPLTEEGVALGRALFHDPRLSSQERQSCASCHQAEAGTIDPGQRFSRGVTGHLGKRNAMPLFNLAWKEAFFWDGRATTLRQQVLMPIQDPLEMNESLENVLSKLKANSHYPMRFADAFGSKEITADRVARALEQFLLTQVSADSKLDRALRGEVTLTTAEKRGFELFHTEYDPSRQQYGADCFHCHGGPLFQNVTFANNGLDLSFETDPGRFGVTQQPGDLGKFSVPSLRNVALTAPYMHDGRLTTLEEVIDHYCDEVKKSPTLDPNLAKHPQGGVPLSTEDRQALVAFLHTLTDPSGSAETALQ